MKKYRISLICGSITILCIVVYNIIGAKVLEDGTLVEPFFLIPIGYLFFFISILSALIIKLRFYFKLKNNK